MDGESYMGTELATMKDLTDKLAYNGIIKEACTTPCGSILLLPTINDTTGKILGHIEDETIDGETTHLWRNVSINHKSIINRELGIGSVKFTPGIIKRS